MEKKNKSSEKGSDSEDKTYLFAFDFDQTITEEHSDTDLGIGIGEGPKFLENAYATTKRWYAAMDLYLKYLAKEGFSIEKVNEHLENLKLAPGMEGLLQKIRLNRLKTPGSKLIIISDGNDYFIRHVLNHLTPPIVPDAIFSNCARTIVPSLDLDTEAKIPYLAIEPYENQSSCQICPPNICKGAALDKYIKTYSFDKTFYCGDGSNDICAALRLNKAEDVLFIRKGYSLEKYFAKGFSKRGCIPLEIKSKVVYYEDGK